MTSEMDEILIGFGKYLLEGFDPEFCMKWKEVEELYDSHLLTEGAMRIAEGLSVIPARSYRELLWHKATQEIDIHRCEDRGYNPEDWAGFRFSHYLYRGKFIDFMVVNNKVSVGLSGGELCN